MSAEWPESCACLYRDALPAATLAAVAADSDAMAAVAPNFWVPREAIEAAAEAHEPRTLAEQVVFELYDRVLKDKLAAECPDWAGAEWWCQVYQRKRGLAFHYDKDEAEMAASGVMKHPAFSCVLYLNDAEECSPPLGATLVMEQRFDSETRRGVPEPSRHDVLVWPTHNALLVFDGALAHGVLDAASGAVRRTMLVNWWRRQPRNVGRATADEYTAVHKLAPPLAGDVAAAPPARAVPIPVCELRAAQDCEDGPKALEEALARRGCGPDDTPAVALHHPDAVVWQVELAREDEQAEEQPAAAEAQHVPLVAALIPDELAGGDSTSGSDSDE